MPSHCRSRRFAWRRASCSLEAISTAGSLKFGSRLGRNQRFDRCLRFFASPWLCESPQFDKYTDNIIDQFLSTGDKNWKWHPGRNVLEPRLNWNFKVYFGSPTISEFLNFFEFSIPIAIHNRDNFFSRDCRTEKSKRAQSNWLVRIAHLVIYCGF